MDSLNTVFKKVPNYSRYLIRVFVKLWVQCNLQLLYALLGSSAGFELPIGARKKSSKIETWVIKGHIYNKWDIGKNFFIWCQLELNVFVFKILILAHRRVAG